MPVLIIEAGRTEKHYWRDLWRYRELFGFLAWRDILVRYKQTVVGVAWALIQPLMTMIVFTVLFGKLAGFPSGGVPYPLLVFAAMLPWQFFANSLNGASNSLIGNAGLISKVYFPRLIVPASAVVVALVDFAINLGFLAALMVWYQYVPTWRILLLPVFTLVAFAAALGVGLWITALTVKYRDFKYVLPFIVQFGLYVSPVGFSSSLVREKFGEVAFMFYSLNPMVGVIDGFRWAILAGDTQPYWPAFALSIILVAVLLASGLWFFRKTERTFADII
jgi:lipopolysaccharide transport system permease protein